MIKGLTTGPFPLSGRSREFAEHCSAPAESEALASAEVEEGSDGGGAGNSSGMRVPAQRRVCEALELRMRRAALVKTWLLPMSGEQINHPQLPFIHAMAQ